MDELGTIPHNDTINLLPTTYINLLLITPLPGKCINQVPNAEVKLDRAAH
jgi:hypothetical protein